MMSPVDTDRFRSLLLDERKRVTAAIDHLHREHPGSLADETGELVSGSADNHMGDTATETFDRELDYTLGENAEGVLHAIDDALGRIDAGSYGTCRVCGREIPEERLEARPWTDLCIDDQRQLERRA
jgi:RNA polymerase-binding protein DksA